MQREIPIETDSGWREALEAWDARIEPIEGKEAAFAFEDIAHSEGENPDAWAWCARAWYFVGDYAAKRQRGEFFERGALGGRRALELAPRHSGALFWTAACAGGFVETIGTLRRAGRAPEILRHLASLRAVDPDYYYGALYRFMGQALVRQPGLARQLLGRAFPELGAPNVMLELRKSIERDPPFVLTHQTLAELAFASDGNRRVAAEMLEGIDALDLDANEELAPENHLDRERAIDKLKAIAR